MYGPVCRRRPGFGAPPEAVETWVRWMDGRSDVWTRSAGWAGLVDVGEPRRLVSV